MSAPASLQIFEFEGFSLNVGSRRLLAADGRPVPLTARAFDILLFMVEHPGELLDKRTLLTAIWGDVVVEENNLNQNIVVLRRVLGEIPGEHRFIVTIPGRGYRFVAPVRRVDSIPAATANSESQPVAPAPGELQTPVAAPAAPAGAATVSSVQALQPRNLHLGIAVVAGLLVLALAVLVWDRRDLPAPGSEANTSVVVAAPTIAVLPFADLSPDKDQEYFADGLSEELASQLARLEGVRVIGRSSAFAFKGTNLDLRKIGAELGVRHLLEGSVRKSGDELRITAQLVDSSTGTRMWSNTYDRELGDVFAVQDDIAQAVAVAMSVALLESDMNVAGGTKHIGAYDAYLSSRALLKENDYEGVLRAVAELERAVSLDPEFALAWSWLARAYEGSGLMPERHTEEWRARADAATARALQLAPDLPSVLAAAAAVSMQKGRWAEAEQRYLRALQSAGSADEIAGDYARFLLNVGRPREALSYAQRIKLAEPLLQSSAVTLAIVHEMAGELDRADLELAGAATLYGNSVITDTVRVMVGMARRDAGRFPALMVDYPESLRRIVLLGLEKPDAALVEMRRLAATDPAFQRPPRLWGIAHWAAYFGDHELSLALLRKALGDNLEGSYVLTLWRTVQKDARRLPAFKDLLRDLGLVDYWRATGKWNEFCQPVRTDDFECT